MKEADRIAGIVDKLRRIFQVVNEHSKRAERVTGLTGPQLWAIKTIAQDAPIMVSAIARQMHLHPATVVGILDRLETHGLVERVRSAKDRRVVQVVLTAQGKGLVRRSPAVAQGLLVDGLEKRSAKELQTISAGLRAMVDILDAQSVPPRLIFSQEVNAPRNKKAKGPRKRPVR